MYKYWVLFICLYMCEVDSSFLGICSNYTNEATPGTRPWHMWGQLYSFCIQVGYLFIFLFIYIFILNNCVLIINCFGI